MIKAAGQSKSGCGRSARVVNPDLVAVLDSSCAGHDESGDRCEGYSESGDGRDESLDGYAAVFSESVAGTNFGHSKTISFPPLLNFIYSYFNIT